MAKNYPETPDGRYFVSKSRLWRKTNPRLDDSTRRAWIKKLMQARNAVRFSNSDDEERAARDAVHEAKIALGERGPVWWDDGAPDETQTHPKNSSYADWWAALDDQTRERGS